MVVRGGRSDMLANLYLSFICIICILLTGCTRSDLAFFDETEDRTYMKAKRFYQDGKYQEALSSFMKVTEEHAVAPESQLEIGRLYLEHIKDPVAAIYHFRKYLEIKPHSEQSAIVRQMIETAQKDFARSLPGPSLLQQDKRLDMLAILKQVRAENESLKKELAEYRSKKENQNTIKYITAEDNKAPKKSEAQLRKENNTAFIPKQTLSKTRPAVKVYTVGVGDTLSNISTKVYGTSARWNDIYEANKDVLNNPKNLKVGQALRMP